MKGALKIKLWGEEMGALMWDRQRKRSYFIYSPTFLTKGLNVAPLVAPVSDIRSRMPFDKLVTKSQWSTDALSLTVFLFALLV